MPDPATATFPPTAAPSRRRRSQAERRATTRAALLDATLLCLADLGYSATTTTEIVRRAGVSRGAQVHHFPTKVELVTAAVDHLFRRRDLEFRAVFAEVAPERRTFDTALDLLWSMFCGPTFDAWLELVVAARTDEELRAAVRSVTLRFTETVAGTFGELFPYATADPMSEIAVRFAFAVLDGLALQRTVGLDEDLPDLLALLKTLARLTLPSPPTQEEHS